MSGGINKISSGELTNLTQQVKPQNSSQSAVKNVREIKSENSEKVQSPSKTPSPHEIKRIISKINENVSRLNKDVKFSYNDTLKSLVVKVIDVKTGKVIREIPPQEVINLQKKLSEVVGIIFDSKEVER